jgi:adenylate kinase
VYRAATPAAEHVSVRLVLFGPPGVGKGTQAELFARARGVLRVSTGDILRDAVQAGSELGRRAKAIMDAGRLIDDETMIGIVTERLARPDAGSGFVLDGFPRTVAQARAFDEAFDDGRPIVVVSIEAPEETLIERLTLRRICANCGWTAPPALTVCERCGGALVQRRDDGVDVVRERLQVYTRQTEPLVEYYRMRPTFRVVDGDQTPEAVAADLAAAVASVVGGRT